MNRMIFVARPRDYRVAGGSEPRIYRPYVKGRRPVQWVVDCYNARGAWEWTHYGEEVMAKPQAKRMAKRSAVMDIPVTDFELSVRARNCLKKMNIRTLGDLVRTTEQQLLAYKNFGETSLKELQEGR